MSKHAMLLINDDIRAACESIACERRRDRRLPLSQRRTRYTAVANDLLAEALARPDVPFDMPFEPSGPIYLRVTNEIWTACVLIAVGLLDTGKLVTWGQVARALLRRAIQQHGAK